jgi:biopolymer transport protein ExbD
MAKIKMHVRTPRIDMTPMVDMFMLLLTFFMLTTNFRPQEAVQVDTPSSISEKLAVDNNILTVYISKDNKIFFNVDNGKDSSQHVRKLLIEDMGKQFRIHFTPEEVKAFVKASSFGMPMKDLRNWLTATDPKEKDAMQVGIPIDSTDNQLAMWLLYARQANPQAEAAIKGDNEADYKTVKRVLDIMQDYKIKKFNLTTNLEKVEVKASDIK